MTVMAERFANNPLDGVASGGSGGMALGNDHAESGGGFSQGRHGLCVLQSEQRPTRDTSALEDIGEF